MKAILILLTVSFGSLATLMNLQRLTAVKDQVIAALPKVEENKPSEPSPIVEPPVVGSPAGSVADVLARYGEPQRKERAMNGTTVYYYPYTIVYFQNNVVVGSRPVGSAQAPQAPITNGQRHWNSTAATGTGTGMPAATSNPGWQGRTNSLGSASLNGSGPTVVHSGPTGGAWQGVGASAPAVSAPRAVVRPSAGAAMYSSGGGSSAPSQWKR